MYCLAKVCRELLLSLNGRLKSHFPALHLVRRLLRAELVMDDLQRTSFLDCAVCRRTVRTVYLFPSERVDSFEERLSLEVLEVGTAEALEVCSTIGLFKEDSCTRLCIFMRRIVPLLSSIYTPCRHIAESRWYA